MLARRVLDLAEQQGLLDGKAIADLRQRLSETKFVVTPEAVAKVLVDHGHLTPFQARKLVAQALGPEPDRPTRSRRSEPEEELTFSEPEDLAELAAAEEEAEGEIVELEAVSPPPAAKKTAPAKSSPSAEKPAKKKKAPAEPQAAGPAVADDDLIGLAPVTARPSDMAVKWKGAAQAEAPAVAAPPPEPIAARDLATDLSAAEQSAGLAPLVMAPARRNIWDSPLLLIGGGLLGVIVIAFGVLLYSLTRGTAAEMFNRIEADYRSGSYTNAIAGYDKFLQSYPTSPDASLARVHRGMAQIRQVTDGGRNPQQGLQVAQQVLPQIENEEKFNEARQELASILPDLADGFATQAGQAEEITRKKELVKQAGAALALVNNPSYLPASVRQDRENRIAGIIDKLKVAQRSIDQDTDLTAAIEKIQAAAQQSDARLAYQMRDELVRTYPALEASAPLLAAIAGVGESERKFVKVTDGGPAAITDDLPAQSTKVIIADRRGPAAGASSKPVFVLVEGAVYGLDAASGQVLWRRFVGYETTIWPVSLPAGSSADALVVDGRRNELLRLGGTTGQLVWRQPLGEALTTPVPLGERIAVTTRGGRMVVLEAASGNIVRSAQLPQAASTAASSTAASNTGQPPRLYQLGEHSTLFVLGEGRLQCSETLYLGHKAGAIFVPPAAVLDQVLVVESPADDYSLVHVLSPDAKTKRLTEVGRPLRLKGRVLVPLIVKGRRVAALTDLGQIAVYEVDSSNPQQPVRLLAGAEPSERTPLLAHLAFDSNRLWTAGLRCTLFDVQPSLAQLSRKWSIHQDHSFLGPPSLVDDLLVSVRKRPGGAAVLVEAARPDSGDAVWTTHLAAPIVGLAVGESRKSVDVVTGEGRLFSLSGAQLQGGVIDAPTFSPPVDAGQAILPEASLAPDQSQLIWTGAQAGGSVFGYNVSAGGSQQSATLPAGAQAAAAAQILGSRWLVPLTSGAVVLLDPAGSGSRVQPFLPPLEPSNLPLWTRPAVSAAGDGFLVSDGRGKVYSVALREQPQPHLAQTAVAATEGPISSPLVLSGGTYVGVATRESNDALVGYDAQAQAAFEPVALPGRCQAGPYAAGGIVLLAVEPGELLCFDSGGKLRWQQRLVGGPLAGPPVICDGGDLLLVYQAGLVSRIDPASGAEVSRHDVGEPLGGAARILGSSVFLAGSDGVLHRASLPTRP